MPKKVKRKVASFVQRARTTTAKPFHKVSQGMRNKPFLSFFIVLGILLAMIIASNVLGTPKVEEKQEAHIVKPVKTYHIGSAPKLTVQAQIRKSGVIKITALTGGVVQRINKNEGDTFYRGNTLVILSSNYQGGNISALQRKLAQVQRDFIEDTYGEEKELLEDKEDLAEELDKVSGNTDLSELQEEVTVGQLGLDKESLKHQKEISNIQVQIAQVTEAAMYPSAPFAGTVDKVFVKVGQAVTPGQVLMQISEDVKADPVTAVAYVSADVAKKVSRLEPSVVHVGNVPLHLYPFHVSQDAVAGLLHAVYYDIPEDYRSLVTENGYVPVDIPVGSSDSSSLVPFVPIDSVYQTKEQNYLFVVENGKATPRVVQLGSVFGTYVQVTAGLKDGDEVVTDRSVIAGDSVKKAE